MTKKRHQPPPARAVWQRWVLTYGVLRVRGERTIQIGEHELRTYRFRAPDHTTAQRFALEHLQHVLRNNDRLELEISQRAHLVTEDVSTPVTFFLLDQYHSRGKLLHVQPDRAAACFSQLAGPRHDRSHQTP